MTHSLLFRFLGEMEIARDGLPVSLPQSRKTRALMAYLVVTSRPHRRDRLCSLLWDLPDDPRGALRWSLSKLRPLVDEAEKRRIVADRETVGFDADGAWVDLFAARKAVAVGFQRVATDELLELAGEFRGDFLDGLDLSDCPVFQAWRTAERDAARGLRVKTLTELVERLTPEPEDAVPHARALVEIDPTDEVYRAGLVGLLMMAGRREEAEEQFEAGLRALDSLGREPSQMFTDALGASPLANASIGAAMQSHETSVAESNRSRLEQHIRFCVASDGAQIAYASIGQGPALVKAANWLNHLEFDWQSPVWRHWLEELGKDHQLVRYDERGVGLSDRDVDDLSFEAFVRDLESVVDASGLERFALLGISQGAAVSIAYAVKHPERVSHLVLFGGYARGRMNRGSKAQIDQENALMTLVLQGWGRENPAFRQVFTSLFIPDGTPDQFDWFNDLQRISTSAEVAVRLRQTFTKIDVRPLLAKVEAPTLVLHSRNDAMVPFEEGRLIAASIPGAEFVSLESRNHLLLAAEPAWPRFLAEVRGFLGSEPNS